MCDAQREMSLEEWVNRLPSFHRAVKEYEAMKAALTKPMPAAVPVEERDEGIR